MIFKFKPNEFYEQDSFKAILDELEIENTILGGQLIFSTSIDGLVQIDKEIDPENVGWYDPDEVWG